jgi:hypothetical protein
MAKSSGDSTTSFSPRGLTLADAFCICLLCTILLTLSYFQSRHRMFWGDEIMGLLTLRQPTFSALLHAWRAGLDSSGIWFYVFGRPWITIFGASEISLRFYSAIGMTAAAAVIWIAARRFYSTLAVASAISFVFAASLNMRWQLSNGRTYGIFMLACALVIYLMLRGESEEGTRPGPLFLLATFGAYTLLTGSHILGVLYAGSFLAIQVALDLNTRCFRPTLYGAAALSLLITLFSHANLQATAALGKPSFWTVRPSLHDLINSPGVLDAQLCIVIQALILLCLLIFQFRRQRTPVYILLTGFLGLDLLFFVISRVSTSIYVDRYMLPFNLAAILLICELLTQVKEAKTPYPFLSLVVPILVLVLAARYFFLPHLQRTWLPYPDYTQNLITQLPPGLPVIDSDVDSFVELEFYHHNDIGHDFAFPVDWESALDPSNTGGVSGFHEMDNFKTLGIYSDDIRPSSDLLSRHGDFAVLTSPTPTAWLQRRILSDPRFSVHHYSTVAGGAYPIDIWLVHTH